MGDTQTKAKNNFLKFLGTAGARFVMIKQLRASGGVWISYNGTHVLIDPGPGSLVRCANSRPKLDPSTLDAIILTHKHLDHSADINVMIEAMTEGGYKKRGVVFAPQDSLDNDPVVLQYLRRFPERIETLSPRASYTVGNIVFQTSMRHAHPVETYGLKVSLGDTTLGLLTDTKYFDELVDFYGGSDILVVGVVFAQPRPPIEHLCFDDVETLVKGIRARTTVLTHFGMTMLKAGPRRLATELSRKLKRDVRAAYDGMTLTV